MSDLKTFIEILDEKYGVKEINKEVSTKFEIAKIIKKYENKTLIFNNIAESDIPVVSGVCNSREKICTALNCKNLLKKTLDGMDNPKPIKKIEKLDKKEYTTKKVDLNLLPILRHYKKDGGRYITSGIVIAKDPNTGIRNASIHRMMVIDKNKVAIRIVPRDLYTYYKESEKLGKDLEVAVVIGVHPAVLFASSISVPINQDELEIANYFHQGEMKLFKCEDVDIEVPKSEIILEGKILANKRAEEGPFLDITGTYDLVRREPILKFEKMHIRKDAIYHAILPAGYEHMLLQGIPQEARIYKAVKNTLPTVKDVKLTEGGCCWLHAVISIKKRTEGDAKNVIMAALSAHPSLKHVVVTDEDIDISNLREVEYAIATRVRGDRDILIIPNVRGSSLDPMAKPDGTTTKVGIDATKPLKNG